MKSIAVIAFDYYGTLEDVHTRDGSRRAWRTLTHFMRYHGAYYTPEALQTAFEALLAEEAARLADEAAPVTMPVPDGVPPTLPEPDVTEVLRLLYAAQGVAADTALLLTTAQVLRAAVTEYFHLYAGAAELLQALRGAGKRLALLSNAQSAYTRPELCAVGAEGLFDRVFISSECGVRKPSAAFYQQLIEWAGVPPQRIMMVGNSPTDDIIPARLMGLRTCYVHSKLTARGAVKPDCDLYLPRPDMHALARLLLMAELP